jgi:Fe-S-cluster containining protein
MTKEAFDIIFDVIDKHRNHFSVNCITHCNGICEDGAVVLLPYEKEHLESLLDKKNLFPLYRGSAFSCGFIAEDEPDCLGLDLDKKTCTYNPYVPFDCLSYPIYPHFKIEGEMTTMYLLKSSICPQVDTINPLFIESAKKIWSLIFEIIDVEWMKLYTQEIDIFFSNPQDEIIYKITKGQRP